MRLIVLLVLAYLVLVHPARAEKAPLSAERLQQEADLIVVGRIDDLRIETEPSQFDPGRGNLDWAIYVTIEVEQVEKGDLTGDRVEARAFRVKTRRGFFESLTPSGHHAIPAVGSRVRAFLHGSPATWEVLLPNGLTPPQAGTTLRDSPEVATLGGGYTYGLPVEIWVVLGLILLVILAAAIALRRSIRSRTTADAHV